MIKKLPFKLTLVVCTFLLSYVSIIAQVSLREIPLSQQIENSSLVVEGKVVSQRSFWGAEHKLIYTAYTVEVYKIFKGEPISRIEVLTLGGTVGLNALIVSHALKIGKGSTGVFTLYDSNFNISSNDKTKNKQFKAYSGVQGFYAYNINEDVAVNPFSKRKGIKSSLYNDILSITKGNFKKMTSFDVESSQKKAIEKSSLLAPTNITFTPPTITAGTGSVLTINGSGFGSLQGKVGFRDSDDGGASFFNALDSHVLTWTDTQITVEVPVISSNDANIAGTAGTGVIRVTDSEGNNDTSAASLTVSFAQINVSFNPGSGLESYQVQHYDDNSSGGYTWDMETGFFNDTDHSGAKASFMRAFDSWRCETKINWEVSGAATATNVIGIADLAEPFDGELDADGENIIMFDHAGFQLDSGTLGTCYSWYSGRGCVPIVWWVTDLDIVFDRETSWYFGENGENFDAGEYDFETVALHELGHGHQLGHVINSSNVMHYALPSNFTSTVLDTNSIAGANDVQLRSTTNQICGIGAPLMTNYVGSCGLSVEDNTLENSISLYPNPTKQQFFIKSTVVNLDKVEIFDVSGRLVSDIDVSESFRTKTVNLNNTAKGMYFVNIHSEGKYITKKLIIE